MWFNSALIVSLLLCAGCLSLATQEIESNNNRDAPSRGELQPHRSTENSRNKTKFDNLNDDVLYLILNYSNLTALTSIAEVRPRFAYFAGKAFLSKYRNYAILIYDGDNYEDYANRSSLLIGDYRLGLNVLKYFGKDIKNLRVDNEMLPHEHSRTINKFGR